MSSSNRSGANAQALRAPSEAQIRRYNEILVTLPGRPRMQVLDWVSRFLGVYDGQPEAQESIVHEIYDFLDFYLQSRNLNRGVLVSHEVQEAFIEEGRRGHMKNQKEHVTDQASQPTHTPCISETIQENKEEIAAHSETADLVELSVTSTPGRDDRGSIEIISALDEPSVVLDENEQLVSLFKSDPSQKRKASEDLSTNSNNPRGRKRTVRIADLEKDIMRAKNREATAKSNCRRKTKLTPGFSKLSKEEQQERLEEDWNRVCEKRHKNGTSYAAFLENLEVETTAPENDMDAAEQDLPG